MLQEHIEKLISTGYKLIALETNSPEQSVNDFRPLVREGKAIYAWESNTGLRRIEASHISIPNTQTPELVINHILQSKHFGIYLLVGFSKAINQVSLRPIYKQFVADKKNNKIIIFIDSHFDYPHSLMSNILIAQEPEVRDNAMTNQTA